MLMTKFLADGNDGSNTVSKLYQPFLEQEIHESCWNFVRPIGRLLLDELEGEEDDGELDDDANSTDNTLTWE